MSLWLVVVTTAISVSRPVAQSRQFDAVSIKRNLNPAAASDTNTTPGRLSLANVTLFSVVARAFKVLAPQIVGAPDWLRSERYDILAVTADGADLTDESRQSYLQALLTERCRFSFHRETRELRAYALVPSKGGHKLTPHEGPGHYSMRIQPADEGRLRLKSVKGNVRRLTEILTGQLGELVVDRTDVTGEYDFALEWAPTIDDGASGPSLFTALDEQLGLKLEAAKTPVPVVVIDRIERPTGD